MALPLERWAKEAVLLERRQDFTPVADKRVLQDLDDMKALQFQTWRQRQRSLVQDGEPIALEGLYAGLNAFPMGADQANVASISGTAALWTTSIWTPTLANALMFPSAWRVAMSGNMTTAATPANIGFDPRIGAGSTVGAAVAGTTMGASTNVALTASITSAYFYVHGDITFRATGAVGANSTAVGYFNYMSTQATASGLAGPAVVGAGHNLMFGHTTASFDSSIAGGFSLGVVNTVTTITYAVKQIHWSSWN